MNKTKLVLISLILLLVSCKKSLKENIEVKIIPHLNNPKMYEFVSLNLIDSISNHRYNKNLIDSLTTQINTCSYKILNVLYDKNHNEEVEKISSISSEIRSLEKQLIKSKKSAWNNTNKKLKVKNSEYEKLMNKYNYDKNLNYFDGISLSMLRDENIIIWDSLIKMEEKKLKYYLNKAQPELEYKYAIKNDSILKTFKFIDSLQNLNKKTKLKTKFYVYEFNYRDINTFNAITLNKKSIITFTDKSSVFKIKN